MSIIVLKTYINASQLKCFDLSRSIELHVDSMANSGEKAIAGRTTGLIQLGESVTWQAKHLGFNFKLTSKITRLEYPSIFVDEMIRGPFYRMKHTHHFAKIGDQTEMTDCFEFKAPFGILGTLVESLFLKKYMRRLLLERNKMIKQIAEQ